MPQLVFLPHGALEKPVGELFVERRGCEDAQRALNLRVLKPFEPHRVHIQLHSPARLFHHQAIHL